MSQDGAESTTGTALGAVSPKTSAARLLTSAARICTVSTRLIAAGGGTSGEACWATGDAAGVTGGACVFSGALGAAAGEGGALEPELWTQAVTENAATSAAARVILTTRASPLLFVISKTKIAALRRAATAQPTSQTREPADGQRVAM